MIFQWRLEPNHFALMLEEVVAGEVQQTHDGKWMATCYLPNAARDGGDFCQTFPLGERGEKHA